MRADRTPLISALTPLLLGLCGCASVGPNFSAPSAPTAGSYAAAGDARPAQAALTSETRTNGAWWRAFGSTSLNTVMDRALAHNQTVAAAVAAMDKAEAEAEHQRGLMKPQLTASAFYQRERINTSAFGFAGFPSPTLNLFSIGPAVSYDLDLAGGGRRRVEAALAAEDAQARRADAAYLALTGNVALQAARIAAVNAQTEIVRAVIDDDRQALDVIRRAQAAGGAATSAGLGGSRQLEEDQALLPPLAQEDALARHALATLVGEAPSEWTPPDFRIADFAVPPVIPVELPSTLVRRRPDILAAEAQLHVDTARIGVATAALYPNVRLGAAFNQEGVTPGSLFGFGASAYNFGPSVSLPIFDGGVLRADRRAAQAQARADLAQYRQTVITAFAQVSDVLSALAQDDARLADLARAESAAKASLDSARRGYALGGAPLSDVVVADRLWRRASLQTVQTLAQKLADVISLYAATAADWRDARPGQTPPRG
jgi:NodT family efflux transporter outer membrane factor (OMF) lipoprotein